MASLSGKLVLLFGLLLAGGAEEVCEQGTCDQGNQAFIQHGARAKHQVRSHATQPEAHGFRSDWAAPTTATTTMDGSDQPTDPTDVPVTTIPPVPCPLALCSCNADQVIETFTNDIGCESCRCVAAPTTAPPCPAALCSCNADQVIETFTNEQGCESCRCVSLPNTEAIVAGIACASATTLFSETLSLGSCHDRCLSTTGCARFSWSSGSQACTGCDTSSVLEFVSGAQTYNLLNENICPLGSRQEGGVESDPDNAIQGSPTNTFTLSNSGQCRQECDDRAGGFGGCGSFVWQPSSGRCDLFGPFVFRSGIASEPQVFCVRQAPVDGATHIANDVKCNFDDDDRFFREEGKSLDTCHQRCVDEEGCARYTFFPKGQFEGVCIGCNTTHELDYHLGALFYELNPSL